MNGLRRETGAPSLTPEEGRQAWIKLYSPGAPYEAKHREAMDRLRLRMPMIFGQERRGSLAEIRVTPDSTTPPYARP